MKRTLLSLLVLCLLPLSVSAEIVIERFTQIGSRTGQGEERTARVKGWIIFDLDETNGAAIVTTVINGYKLYFVDREGSRTFRTTLSGTGGRVYTVVTKGETKTNEVDVLSVNALLARGLNTTLQISESRQLTYPRVMRSSGHRVERQGGSYVLDETSSTRIFSQTETRDANGLDDDVEAAIAKIIQRLQQAGYIDAS